MTAALCPECLAVWTRHQSAPVQGLGFDRLGRPISGLPREYCPDHKQPPKPRKGKR